ncbi:bacteriocin-protection, ydeI or ompD-Associated domain-containing protein [Purpureocillium lavendulum]|uniref:Bacteriocin-protection, ydeI or ompD-Associated domain-containing protein n=1 Tax=Purpureocillium lavendulum TaxID=1247861 RepID=A0AB34FYJ0_9HYPO|nr:bacteriocin-protection, ydeI or ompD-Associated domain-containing protein [Purpureocillium lavendulum]
MAFPDADAFTAWLAAHGASTPSGILLRIGKKAAPFPSVSYASAVDVALCHGWIDGQRRAHDEHSFLQRFTPRRPRSLWSRRNVARVAALAAEGRMHPAGQAEVDAARADGRWDRAYAGAGDMHTPRDFEDALRAHGNGDGNGEGGGEGGAAWRTWEALGRSKRYPFLWRIETVKRDETRRRKIEEFVALLAEGKTLR